VSSVDMILGLLRYINNPAKSFQRTLITEAQLKRADCRMTVAACGATGYIAYGVREGVQFQ